MATAPEVMAWITASSGAGPQSLSGDDEPILERVIAAVEAHIAKNHTAPDPITEDWEQAVIMQSARLWQRRNTPSGVEGIGDFGPVRVTRVDHDVSALLADYRDVDIP